MGRSPVAIAKVWEGFLKIDPLTHCFFSLFYLSSATSSGHIIIQSNIPSLFTKWTKQKPTVMKTPLSTPWQCVSEGQSNLF